MINGRLQRKSDALNCAVLGFTSLIIYIVMIINNKLEFTEEVQMFDMSTISPLENNDFRRAPKERQTMNHFPFASGRFLSPPSGRSMTLYETNHAFIVLEEVLQQTTYSAVESDPKKTTNIIEYSFHLNKKQEAILLTSPPSTVIESHYTKRHYKPMKLKLGDRNSVWDTENRTLSSASKYFSYFDNMQAQCKKLVRLGGTLNCDNVGDENRMDGHKVKVKFLRF
ncbi:hypothetical protein SK128_008276 [Halocaridina rubra]|uniref:Uncharacterized protein n=1 Tax=Halocaridina rubra TaxID=373956 RepID=A0AAN8WL67_HALRR